MKTFLTARASFAIAESIFKLPTSAGAAEYNIQWMPPGYQDITCWVGGQPRRLRFTVTAKLAETFAGQFQTLLVRARAGKGDKPLTDYNHDKREASSRPVRLEWGGDDLEKGGIRLIGKWTSKARAAIQDEEFDRFSPQWDFEENSDEPVSIGVNVGGLVNQAAFQNIAQVQAKDASVTPDNSDKSSDAAGSFYKLVLTWAEQRKITFAQALNEIQRGYPQAVTAYAKAMRMPAGPHKSQPNVVF